MATETKSGEFTRGAAAVMSVLLSGGALAVSIISYQVARTGDDRLARQDLQTYAANVYLSEGPGDVSDPVTNHADEWVFNTSSTPVSDVWVAGRDSRFVNIGRIAPCDMYELPPNFAAVTLYFRDPKAEWRRDLDGQPVAGAYKSAPATESEGTGRTLRAENCK
jgi:hypothetical protein